MRLRSSRNRCRVKKRRPVFGKRRKNSKSKKNQQQQQTEGVQLPAQTPGQLALTFKAGCETWHINQLPDSVLVSILGYCSPRTILNCARVVCKRWYRLCRDQYVWSGHRLIASSRTSTYDVLELISYAVDLRQLLELNLINIMYKPTPQEPVIKHMNMRKYVRPRLSLNTILPLMRLSARVKLLPTFPEIADLTYKSSPAIRKCAQLLVVGYGREMIKR